MLRVILGSILFGIISVKSDEAEAVFTLTSDNFDEFIANNPKALVEFYAPWCGHCKALAPEYEKAAKQLKADGIETVLAKVDATEEKDLSSKYGVRGFPTLKYFTGDVDNPQDYSGGRTADTIISWLSVRALPAVSELSSAEDIEAFKKKGKVTIIGYLGEESQQKVLSDVADAMRDSVIIGQVTDSSLGELGKIVLYASFNDEDIELKVDDSFDDTVLTDFINGERFPLIDEIGPENYKDYMDRGLPLVWISLDASDDEVIKKVKEALNPRAKENKNSLSFVYVDNVKYKQHVQNLGITEDPGLLIVAEPKKYLFKGDLMDDGLTKTFFDDYSAGKLEPHLKSQEIPEANDEPVFVLVGKAFDDVVGQDKDVFVEYYAPWCGHCKRLAPEYEKVGEAFKSVDDVLIAKVDATENDTPEEIKGFPTLIFYPKGSKEGKKYNGDRTAEAIIQYIKDEATVDVSAVKEEL
eukprot:CAMPEP_0114672498 /NCGR_PEP_ID=MMETSP0191-20121206/43023_1 /TAXON_ID=126664 /ORGANISM="Sorites sp." /LENGTH=467 /DNA_ID=CAMNT_0001935011 /DNA_START=61 /DNA_END=1464 /DNA_ORIENTATION=-